MAQVVIFKENILDQVRKDLDCELFYSELNVTTSHTCIYLLIDNIHTLGKR